LDDIGDAVRAKVQGKSGPRHRIICPECAHTRKRRNQNQPTMNVTADGDAWIFNCHHCGAQGISPGPKTTYYRRPRSQPPEPPPPPPQYGTPLTPEAIAFASSRGISRQTLEVARCFSDVKYMREMNGEVPVLAFPYMTDDGDGLLAAKYRSLQDKHFTQNPGGASTLFGVERLILGQPLFIFEGEIDALTLTEAGIQNGVSVPAGAVSTPSAGPIREDEKAFAFLRKAERFLKDAPKVVIASDGDQPGGVLGEELVRRIGRDRCWKVEYPDGCKDINDVLMQHGAAKVTEVVKAATPWPVVGLHQPESYFPEVRRIYVEGHVSGARTGLPSVDDLFTVVPGQVSIVTGIPASGKSEFVDQLMVNLTREHDWRFGVCSFENPPEYHVIKLAEKVVGKPFSDGPKDRMNTAEMEDAFAWINDHFSFIVEDESQLSTIDSILERAKVALLRSGIKGLVIDPYNYVEMNRRESSETELISSMLSKVRGFARANDIHVWFVAHPAKMPRIDGRTPIPTGYDISGSAAWFSKADLGVTVHKAEDLSVEIHVWKCRFKWTGKQGVTALHYDLATGIYSEQTKWGPYGNGYENQAQAAEIGVAGYAGGGEPAPWDKPAGNGAGVDSSNVTIGPWDQGAGETAHPQG